MSKHHIDSLNSDIDFNDKTPKTFAKKARDIGVGFVLAMIFVGMGMWGIGGFYNNGKENYIAQIGNEIITEMHVETEMIKLKKRLPDMSFNPYIRSLVIQDLILSKILKQEAKSLNLNLSNEVIAQYIAKNKEFADENGFNKNKFNSFLSNAGLTEAEYIEKIRQKIVTDVIVNIIGLPKIDFSNLATLELKMKNQKRIIDLFIIPNDSTNTVLSEQELSDFYLSHKNLFVEKSQMQIEYISSDDIISKHKASLTKQDLEDEFNKTYNQKHSERRAIYLLSLNSQEDIDKALFLLKNRKKNFIEVASIFNKKEKDISIDSIGYFDLQPNIRDIVFELPLNKISDAIQISSDKFIVVQVRKIMTEKLDIAEKNNIINSLSDKLLKQKNCEKLMSYRDQARDLLSSGKELKDVANILDVALISKKITQESQDKFIDLFEKSVNFVDIIENGECSFDVVRIAEKQETRNKDFNEAYKDISTALKKVKTEEYIFNIANEVKSNLEKMDRKNATLMKNFIQGRKMTKISDLKVSRQDNNLSDEMKIAIYDAKKDDIMGPFIRKDGSFVVAILNNIDDNIKYSQNEITQISSEIWEQKQHDMQDLYKNYLYKKYNVKLYEKINK
jgi:hypothetical protein